MFRVVETSGDAGDSPVRISVHSNGDSVREDVSPSFNIGASGVSHTAEQTLRSGRPSIFALRSSYLKHENRFTTLGYRCSEPLLWT